MKMKTFVMDFLPYYSQDLTEAHHSQLFVIGYDEKYGIKEYDTFPELFESMKKMRTNIKIYFPDLKFSGSFLLSFLEKSSSFEAATYDDNGKISFVKRDGMKPLQYRYTISDTGKWYEIKICLSNRCSISFQDASKLFRQPLSKLAKDFCGITFDDKDPLIYYHSIMDIPESEIQRLKEKLIIWRAALKFLDEHSDDGMTIGSRCLHEFKSHFHFEDWNMLYPNLVEYKVPDYLGNYDTAQEFFQEGFRGAWCYKDCPEETTVVENGITLDCNALYAYSMHSRSGNVYPCGSPRFFQGEPKESQISKHKSGDQVMFIKVRTRFKLKDGFLPFIQVKNSICYNPKDCLETSDVWNYKTKKYYDRYKDRKGNIHQAKVTLVMPYQYWQLIQKHYDVYDVEYLGGAEFMSDRYPYTDKEGNKKFKNNFDGYIEKYEYMRNDKLGSMRALAKMFTVNLFGKFGSTTKANYKIAIVKEDGSLGFQTIPDNSRHPVFTPAAACVTVNGLIYTITAAQANYYGKGKKGFRYSDTDSLHLDIPLADVKGVEFSDTEYGKWKVESVWEKAWYYRQKTYIMLITEQYKNRERIKCNPTYEVTCAGMSDRCSELLAASFQTACTTYNTSKLSGVFVENRNDSLKYSVFQTYSQQETDFLMDGRKTPTDFKDGLAIPSNPQTVRISGGSIKLESYYTIQTDKYPYR